MSQGIKVFFTVLLQCLCLMGRPQVVTNVRHYSTADGLSDNRVTDITKDSEGFMWFGSWAGITRFDGYNFLTFKSYPGDRSSLKSNRIDEIVEDSEHRHLWLRAYDKQVYRFDKRTQEFTPLSDLLKDPAVGRLSFAKILAVRANQVWLKTEGQGILLIRNPAATNPSHILFSKESTASSRLPTNDYHFFFTDRMMRVWLGTSSGLRVLDPQSDGSYKVRSQKGLEKEVYTGISEAKGKIWLKTASGTAYSFDLAEKKVKTYQVSNSSISHILASKYSDNIYCTTQAGDFLAIKPGGRIVRLFGSADGSPLFYIYEDKSGACWIESKSYGIVRFDPATKSPEYLFPSKAYPFDLKVRNFSVFEDKDGTVWINLGGNLSIYNRKKKRIQPLSLEAASHGRGLPKNITRTFYDPAGVLWLGSGFEGVDKLTFREYEFTQYEIHSRNDGRASSEVRGILADSKNRLWLGTKAGELIVSQNGARISDILLSEPINTAGVYSILEDRSGRVWMGTKANGLIKASPAGNRYKIDQYIPTNSTGAINSNSIYCLFQDRQGRLWAGSYDDGLILIEERNGKVLFKNRLNCFNNYPKDGFLKIRHLAEDAAGRIWIGTTAGLLVFNPDSEKPENYKFRQYRKIPGDINSLGGNDIQFIYCDSKNQMWVLTTTGGLNLAQGNDPLKNLSFINYSGKDGLPSDFLLSCTEDRAGNLWIATQNGISKYSIKKNSFQNFNYSDGLQQLSFSEASCTTMKDGKIVFGNTAGYLVFDPAKIQARGMSAPMVFTNLQINSEDIRPGINSPLQSALNYTEKIDLNYDQNVISIDFAVLDYHSTDKQSFAYRLVGFDNVWRSSEGQRRATYIKLPPGNFKLEVKSLNEELYGDIPSRSIQITIHPPFWKTWWAYTIYFLIISAGLLFVRRLAITMFKLRQGIEVERRLADLKLNFFTQISHELRTPLTLILNPSEEVLENEGLSIRGKEYMGVVVKNARRMLRMVNQVLDLRKVQSGSAQLQLAEIELVSFIRNILGYFTESLSEKKLKIDLQGNSNELRAYIDPEKLEIVIYNLLANAIKFSPTGSVIHVLISRNKETQSFSIEVADEGPGVQYDELQDIFKLYYEGKHSAGKHTKGTGIGLALSRELVELHMGKIYASHNFPSGLRVIVELSRNLKGVEQEGLQQHRQILEPAIVFPIPEEPSGIVKPEAAAPVVLIVEDNDDLRAFLESKFSDLYIVETACNGVVGLEKAKALLPDLVLSDIMMPEMDGIQLLDHLKNDPATSHIPVILLTARYSVESQIESLKYGADYYITKPFQMDLLLIAVGSIIGQRKKLFRTLVNKEEHPISETEGASITAYDREFLEKIIRIVEDKLQDSEFNIDDVADSLGMSRSAFYKKFKSLTNIAPVEFVRELRLKKAKELFDAGEDNVSVAAYAAGFNNPKYFSTCFKAQYQKTPTEYLKSIRKQGQGTL